MADENLTQEQLEEKRIKDEAIAKAEKAEKELIARNAKRNRLKDIPILKQTKDNYLPEENEMDIYHARIEVKSFNSKTGKRNSKPHVLKSHPKAFGTFLANCVAQGYHVDILFDPTGKYPKAGIQDEEETKK